MYRLWKWALQMLEQTTRVGRAVALAAPERISLTWKRNRIPGAVIAFSVSTHHKTDTNDGTIIFDRSDDSPLTSDSDLY